MKFVSKNQLQRVLSGFKHNCGLGLTKTKMLDLIEHRLIKRRQCLFINQQVVVPRISNCGARRGDAHPF